MLESPVVEVVGAGLAGCELAWRLARYGVRVRLIEQKPTRRSPAHSSDHVAELVCSNSLRSDQLANAAGLLKAELRLCDSLLMRCAEHAKVPAGSALAVDREVFSKEVRTQLDAQPGVEIVSRHVEAIASETSRCVLATGPLTDGELAAQLTSISGQDTLFFYDAIAPIIETDSIDRGVVFAASRWGKGEAEDYLNVPLDRQQYETLVQNLLSADKVTPHGFEDKACFEGCLPVEVMAGRGAEVLSHGPFRPVGLVDPRSGRRPHAVIQLRKENVHDSSRNLVGFQTRMTQGAQLQLIRSLPGLSHAKIERYGSIHRNSYVDAPRVLDDGLQLHNRPGLWIAGQLAGSEGYVEAIALGVLIAESVLADIRGEAFVAPSESTALGGLYRHLRKSAGRFEPSNVTWGMIRRGPRAHSKAEQRQQMAATALSDMKRWLKRQETEIIA